MSCDSRRSLITDPNAFLFLGISQEGVFQQTQALTLIDPALARSSLGARPAPTFSAPHVYPASISHEQGGRSETLSFPLPFTRLTRLSVRP